MKNIRFFSSLAVLSLLVTFQIAAQNWGVGMKGEGSKVTQTLDIASFNGVGLGIDAEVYVRQGSTQSVKIEAQQNIIDNIKRKVMDGVWMISFDKNVRQHEGIKIWITTTEDFRKIAVSGSGSVIGEGKFSNLDKMAVIVSGSGDITFDSDSKSLYAAISGSGDINLKGATGDCEMKITGSGDISAFDLVAQNCSVNITGSGDSSVNVREKLDVAIVGSGDVVYKGTPNVRSKITGSGDVTSK